MALQMASAVATGTPFLGHSTTKCDVAYLDLEGSKSRISFRSAKMSTQIPSNVFVTNSITERLADGLVNKLRQLHRARPSIRLIIVDTYSRARGSYKAPGANAYDADIMLLEPVQRMALEENIALLFVHHDKKGAGLALDSFERLSGTMGISGSCDCVINLVADGKRFDGKASMEFTPRDAKGGEMSLVLMSGSGSGKRSSKPSRTCAAIRFVTGSWRTLPNAKKRAELFLMMMCSSLLMGATRTTPGARCGSKSKLTKTTFL